MGHYRPTSVRGEGSAVPTLYERAGGAEAFSRLTEAFYAKVLEGDLLAPVFAGLAPEHAEHVALWLVEVFGGPAACSATQGGHGHMVAEHAGRGITEPQCRRWVNLVQDAADKAGLPTRTRSSARPSSPTSSGAPASPCTSRARTRSRRRIRRCRSGGWG